MTEYINKAELWEIFNQEYEKPLSEKLSVEEIIEEAPTIYIVTCKECKHSNVDKMGWYCKKHYHRFTDEDKHFCSYGERSDDNDT